MSDLILQGVTPDQLKSIEKELQKLFQIGHGELILTVKNGELYYMDTRTSKMIKKERREKKIANLPGDFRAETG